MPKGYIIGHITVNDPEAYAEYVRRDTPMFAAHGGVPIVRGGTSETPEGETFSRHVVFEFESYEAARTFYNAPEYQEIIKIRHAAATSMIVLVEGV